MNSLSQEILARQVEGQGEERERERKRERERERPKGAENGSHTNVSIPENNLWWVLVSLWPGNDVGLFVYLHCVLFRLLACCFVFLQAAHECRRWHMSFFFLISRILCSLFIVGLDQYTCRYTMYIVMCFFFYFVLFLNEVIISFLQYCINGAKWKVWEPLHACLDILLVWWA